MNIRQSKLVRMGAATLVAGGLRIGTLAGVVSAATVDRYGGPSGRTTTAAAGTY